MFFFINNVFADVNNIDKIVFFPKIQPISQNIISTITIQTQNIGGTEEKITESINRLTLSTNSTTGEFSSSKDSWKVENIITMNKNTYNKNFYYRDISEGNFIITAKLTSGETGKSWTVTQDITVGDSSGGDGGGGSSTSTLESISITTPPTKIIYGIGDTLDISGMVVTGTYSNDSTLVEAVTSTDVSGFNSSVATSSQILTVSHEGKTTTFPVTISSSTPPSDIKIVYRYISTHSDSEDLSDYTKEESFQISAGRERMSYVGTPLNFTAKNNKNDKNAYFTWSFGDITEGKGNEVSHTYKKAGEYIVVLNADYNNEKAVSRINVKVLEPKIILNIKENDLEIENSGENEINIGGWKIKNTQANFLIPQDTIIGSKNKIILSFTDIPNMSLSGGLIIIEDQSLNIIDSTQTSSDYLLLTKEDKNKIILKSLEEVEKILGIKVVDAEKLVLEYKAKTPSFSLKPKIDKLSESNFSLVKSSNGNKPNDIEEIKQVATVEGSINSTSSISFWKKMIDLPVNGIKAIVGVFYDF